MRRTLLDFSYFLKNKKKTETAKSRKILTKKSSENNQSLLQTLCGFCCCGSVCVWLSSIKPVNTGLQINKLDAMCRLHLPSYRSTPSVVQSISLSCFGLRRKGVTQFPHLVELRCRRICMKTNYVLSEENEKVAKCCSLMLWQKR